MTLIVLGESILSSTGAIQSAMAEGGTLSALLPVIVGGLLCVYSMWWVYFDRPAHTSLTSVRRAIMWGYGHYFVFASAAAVGAGIAVGVDQATHPAEMSSVAAGFAVAVPVAVFIASLWLLHEGPEHRQSRTAGAFAVALILLSPLTGQGVLLTGAVFAFLVAIKLVLRRPGEEQAPSVASAASSH
jgi:low temperature requirement protein LtrA